VAASAATGTFVDDDSDAVVSAKEILYTDGGVFGNDPPDGCAMLAMGADRAYLVGWDRRYVQVSRIIVQGEPVQFVNSSAFWIPLPEPATGLAYCDGSLVVFTATGAYATYVDGAGPNDQGQGSFGQLRALPSNGGCIDERSICVTAAGIFYQSRDTIMLLPRGFGAPVPIGEAVQDTLASYPVIAGTALITDEQGERVHFLALSADAASISAENSRCLVYDLRFGAWSIDRYLTTAAKRIGSLVARDGELIIATAEYAPTDDQVFKLTEGWYYDDDSDRFEQRVEFAAVRPFGLAGTGDFQAAMACVEWIGDCTLNFSAKVDAQAVHDKSWSLTGSFTAGDQLYRYLSPPHQQGTEIVLKLYDSVVAGAYQKGFAIHSLALQLNPTPGLRRPNAGERL